MASHFACIGLPFESPDELREFTERALAETARAPRGRSERALWRDASGALVAFHLEDDTVVCTTPGFGAGGRLRVRVDELVETPECRYCLALAVSVLDDDGEVVTRFAFQLVDPERVRNEVRPGDVVDATIAAFGDHVEHWPGEEAYEQSLTDEPAMAAESFVPTGMFADLEPSKVRRLFRRPPPATPGDVMSHGLVTGRVLGADAPTNTISGVRFAVLRVRSFGADFELVADGDELGPPPTNGGIVQAHCWFVGDVAAADG